jgi:uncharacterized protein (DUF1330 family)
MKSAYIQPSEHQLSDIMNIPMNEPVVMINLLKYKTQTDDGLATGQERYAEYAQQVQPFLQASGGEVVFMGKSFPTLVGPNNENWDQVALVKYPSLTHFLEMIRSEGYPHEIRSSALADSRLIPSIE